MTCPECGHQNGLEDRFCMECGKPLEEQASSEPEADQLAGAAVDEPPAEPSLAETEPPPAVEELPAYRASGRCPAASVLGLLLAAILGGVLLGGVYHLVGRFLDVPVLFAVLAGMGAGGVVALGVLMGRCRNPALAFLFGLLAGLLMYGARTTFDAYQVRPLMVEGFTRAVARDNRLSPGEARVFVERMLDPRQTVTRFLEFQSRVGITITSGYSSRSQGTPVKGTWFWLLFAAEMSLAGIVGGAVARESALRPYCETCQRWLDRHVLFKGNPGLTQTVLGAVRVRDWEGLAGLPTGQFNEQNHCAAVVTRCAGCQDAAVTVETTSANKKHTSFRGRLTDADTALLTRLGKLPHAAA